MDPIAILRAKKAKILADAHREARAVEADLREIEKFQLLAQKYGLELVEKANGQIVPRLAEKPNHDEIAVDTNRPIYKAAISVAEQALRRAGHPLELSEIFDACTQCGVKLGGARPQSTLSAYLSAEKSTVYSIRKGVYWLKNVPVPAPS